MEVTIEKESRRSAQPLVFPLGGRDQSNPLERPEAPEKGYEKGLLNLAISMVFS